MTVCIGLLMKIIIIFCDSALQLKENVFFSYRCCFHRFDCIPLFIMVAFIDLSVSRSEHSLTFCKKVRECS